MHKGDLPDDQYHLTEKEWRKKLSSEQYHVLREKGTEPAFQNAYWDCKKDGVYECAGCSCPLFSSSQKFDSGTGWPSFTAPIEEKRVSYEDDESLFSRRVEVLCARCRSHLGHVFDDGPPPGRKRYCMNSAALKFVPVPP